jgi:hypothetical protein
MDVTVVHYKHRVGIRIGLHIIEDLFNKSAETFCTKRAFNNIAMENAIIQRKSGQDRKAE